MLQGLGEAADDALSLLARALQVLDEALPLLAHPLQLVDQVPPLGAGLSQSVGAGFELQALVGRSGRGERNTGLFLGASYRFGGGR